jgi:hypothetical protein
MADSFAKLAEYIRLVDEFNLKSSREYNGQDSRKIRNTELREIVERIEDTKEEIINGL